MFTPRGQLCSGIYLAAAQQNGSGTGTNGQIAFAMINAARNAALDARASPEPCWRRGDPQFVLGARQSGAPQCRRQGRLP
jgi:hypothetical protein